MNPWVFTFNSFFFPKLLAFLQLGGVFNAELNEFLARTLGEDGYAGVEVRVTPIRTEIIIRATRRGLALGPWGNSLEQIDFIQTKIPGFDMGIGETDRFLRFLSQKIAMKTTVVVALQDSWGSRRERSPYSWVDCLGAEAFRLPRVPRPRPSDESFFLTMKNTQCGNHTPKRLRSGKKFLKKHIFLIYSYNSLTQLEAVQLD